MRERKKIKRSSFVLFVGIPYRRERYDNIKCECDVDRYM